MAGEFIRKCVQFADHIAMILPVSFLKDSYQNRHIPENFHVMWSKRLDNCEFSDCESESVSSKMCDSDDESCDCEKFKKKAINCAFIYFKKLDYPRPKRKKIIVKPNNFWDLLISPSKKERQDADIRIRGSGANAGKAFCRGEKLFYINKDRSDDYFVVLSRGWKKDRSKLCKKLSSYEFKFMNTVPNVKYLNKQQVIKAVNKITEK